MHMFHKDHRAYISFLFIAFSLSLFSCTDNFQNQWKSVPNAFGMANQVVVLTDTSLWEGPVGDSTLYYYSSPFLLLPQPEPIFDLKHFTPIDLRNEPIRKELRTYLILADLEDEDSPTTALVKKDLGSEKLRRAKEDSTFNFIVGRDKWARNQLLVYQFGFGEEDLINNLIQNFPTIRKQINKFDTKQIAANTFQGKHNQAIESQIEQIFDAKIEIPSDYKVAMERDDFFWIRKDTRKLISNFIFHQLPYADTAQFSKNGIVKIQDKLGKKYVASEAKGSYMRTNVEDLPVITQAFNQNGNYAFEARGVWEMEKDFMGGPFISMLFHNPEKESLFFVQGFIFAPNEDKRDFMQQVEYILSTVKY